MSWARVSAAAHNRSSAAAPSRNTLALLLLTAITATVDAMGFFPASVASNQPPHQHRPVFEAALAQRGEGVVGLGEREGRRRAHRHFARERHELVAVATCHAPVKSGLGMR
jgi:hypothetical protein